jgi:hypothetical protein
MTFSQPLSPGLQRLACPAGTSRATPARPPGAHHRGRRACGRWHAGHERDRPATGPGPGTTSEIMRWRRREHAPAGWAVITAACQVCQVRQAVRRCSPLLIERCSRSGRTRRPCTPGRWPIGSRHHSDLGPDVEGEPRPVEAKLNVVQDEGHRHQVDFSGSAGRAGGPSPQRAAR